jgi:uncharacterized protein with NRDE domain
VTHYGYLTHIFGLVDELLFADANVRSEATARFTFLAVTTLDSRHQHENIITTSAPGELTLFLNQNPGADFNNPASFAGGRAIASYSARYHNVLNVQAPNQGITAASVELTQLNSSAFVLGNRRTDLRAGGTWLGVNEFGLLVAITNRKKQSPPENPPSRGLLCRSLLAFRETASAVASALRELDANAYAGCNLLIANRESATVIEAGEVLTTTRLDPGLHLIANRDFAKSHGPVLQQIIDVTSSTAKWAEAHRDEVAKSLSAVTGIPLDIQTVAANRSSFAVGPITDDIVATQQGVADRFFKLGLIPKPVVVRDAVWKPAQT